MTDEERVISPTEERNPRTVDIDRVPVLTLLERINDEDALVAARVRSALPQLATLVEAAVECLTHDGQVHYFGAGSSGRLGLLDAAELGPTFGIQEGRVVAHLAGGDRAMRTAQEGVEDSASGGAADAGALTTGDVAIGITASGRTPYVGAALRTAQAAGAFTALITSNPAAPLARWVDVVVCADTGPEVIAGSTRMKAATAQKLILNAFSTAVMIRLGRTWSNLMTAVLPTNAKLRGRLVHMLMEASGLDEDRCAAALQAANGAVDTALVMLIGGVSVAHARHAVAGGGGVAQALAGLDRDAAGGAADDASA